MATATLTIAVKASIIMTDEQDCLRPMALLRMQSWLSPAFPTGAYSYSDGLEWAIEAGEAKILIDPFLSDHPSRDNR